jgi:hypothetical protein
MSVGIENTHRSNHSIFFPQDCGSPLNDITKHISGLGLARLDFERSAVAGEVIYSVEGDSTPVSQQDEEARIGAVPHALAFFRSLAGLTDEPGNAAEENGARENTSEFMRCLNEICREGDARSRQIVASHYYDEAKKLGASPALKEMALLAMRLASLNPVTEETDGDSDAVYALSGELRPGSLFDLEVAGVNRMIRGRRKGSGFAHDEWTEWLNDLEANGATLDELDDAFAHVEALDQYDEGGAIIRMSAHERTVACGRADHEFTADDLPEQARFLAGDLIRAYASGVEIEEIWDDINAKLDVLFPVKAKRFFSWANIELGRLTRDALEAILDDCYHDCHLTAMRHSRSYRRFYRIIREADDTKIVGQAMKEAYAAKESGCLSLKHFTLLKAASGLQRERLERAPLSKEARRLIREVETASSAKLRYLSWAFYGANLPSHPIHTLAAQEVRFLWRTLKARKQGNRCHLKQKMA